MRIRSGIAKASGSWQKALILNWSRGGLFPDSLFRSISSIYFLLHTLLNSRNPYERAVVPCYRR